MSSYKPQVEHIFTVSQRMEHILNADNEEDIIDAMFVGIQAATL